MILEEEFDKDGEPWYDPQDLEHGKRLHNNTAVSCYYTV